MNPGGSRHRTKPGRIRGRLRVRSRVAFCAVHAHAPHLGVASRSVFFAHLVAWCCVDCRRFLACFCLYHEWLRHCFFSQTLLSMALVSAPYAGRCCLHTRASKTRARSSAACGPVLPQIVARQCCYDTAAQSGDVQKKITVFVSVINLESIDSSATSCETYFGPESAASRCCAALRFRTFRPARD